MSYSLGKDVSTVVKPVPPDMADQLDADMRRAIAHQALTHGTALQTGDIWNGKEVTEDEAKVFFRPSHVSFIEG